MSLEVTELFQGKGTKRLVISYKEGSDFDLVLSKLQSDHKVGKSHKNISKLIRDLVVSTNGCSVFEDHPQVNSKQYRQFCLQALGLISGYREIISGYLGFIGGKIASPEASTTEFNFAEKEEEEEIESVDHQDMDELGKEMLVNTSYIDSLLPGL